MIALALLVAIVAEDGSSLRAAPADDAPKQVELVRGDWLEVRGEDHGFLKVYHHRRERPGYVRPWRVRLHELSPAAVPDLLAITLFLRDAPGQESLGIGYGALYLRAAGAGETTSAVHDAIGTMAERLARRASATRQDPAMGPVAAHVDVATSYGVAFQSHEAGGRTRLVYDGAAFRQVLATSRDPRERARAALSLTRDDGLAEASGAVATRLWNAWRLEVLEQTDGADLPAWLSGRLALRKAEVLAWVCHELGVMGDAASSARAGAEAQRQLALADPGQLMPEDRPLREQAALRVASVRWSTREVPASGAAPGGALRATVLPTQGGGWVLRLEGKAGVHEHATASLLWPGSLLASPDGRTVVAVASPTPTWSELVVLRRGKDGWSAAALPPSADGPGVGYVEPAGFSPDGTRLCVAREAIVEGKLVRTFEVIRLDTLHVEAWGASPERKVFRRFTSAAWRAETLATRSRPQG